jgi:tripartite-type tricarboxylate transporter receptor subunit TctC
MALCKSTPRTIHRSFGVVRTATAMVVAASSVAFSSHGAGAETVAGFYRGKTITLYIGTGSGAGAVSAYPNAMVPFLKKYIPGHPNVILSNMPGAGGIKAANYIYKIAPQDGTAMGFITRGVLLAPLLKLDGVQFVPTKFNWIGSPSRTVSVGAVWNAATDVRTIQDAMKKEVVLGATAPNQDTAVFPRALNALIGTKFRVVTGYPSVGAVDLAMARKEVQGKVGFTWNSLNSGPSVNWVKDKIVNVIVQLGTKKAPDIPDSVPLALDLTRTKEDREVLLVLCAPSAAGYPGFMGPDVPQDRVAAVRKAYGETMRDPEFKAALDKQSLDLDPIPADELTDTVASIYKLSAPAVERAREIVGSKK